MTAAVSASRRAFSVQLPAAPLPTPALASPRSAATPAPPPGPAPEQVDPELLHWRDVFQEFLRVREACGESNDGLGYERFEAKPLFIMTSDY